jgi:hypothetical protein
MEELMESKKILCQTGSIGQSRWYINATIAILQRVRVTLRLGAEPTLWTFDQILLPFQGFGSGICSPVSVRLPL